MRPLPFLLVTVVASAHAAIEVSDLRIGLGAYGVTNARWSESYQAGPWSPPGTVSGSGSGTGWDGNAFGAFSVRYTGGDLPYGGGFIWAAGFEVAGESHHSDVLGFPNQPVTTSTFAFTGRLGFGLPIGPRVHLEMMPELYAGWLSTDVYDTDGYSLERTTGSGGYGAVGFHLGCYVEAAPRLVLGGSFGVRRCAGHYDANFSTTGGYDEGSLYFTQWGGQFEIGVRF